MVRAEEIKLEAQNPGEASRRDQFETNPNDRNTKFGASRFENLKLEFVSSFEFRISDFNEENQEITKAFRRSDEENRDTFE